MKTSQLVCTMQDMGVDKAGYEVEYRRITEWPDESAVSAFVYAHAVCTGEDLDDLKTPDEVVRNATVALEAIKMSIKGV